MASRPAFLAPTIPTEILDAARRFAAAARSRGQALDDDRLNNGPSSLAEQLPAGWERRLQRVFAGKSLILSTLGRADLLRSKVFSLCDRGIDMQDCIALAPSAEELEELLPWLTRQDLHPGWPEHVRETVADLGRRLGHGV